MLKTCRNNCYTKLKRHRGYRPLSHFRVVEHVIPASYIRTYPGAIELDAETSLRLSVKQYVPHNQPKPSFQSNAVTIIGGHANGFAKELYEPLWDDLYENLSSRGQSIQGVWIADIAHQGQSGRLNEAMLGNDPNWWDHARDLLFLINQKQGQLSRPMIGVGHSMGGSILTALALLHPSLFQSLVLIDPVIQTENPSKKFAPPSTYRRDRWQSQSAAHESFRRSKFYQAWDNRVLDKWLEHGLRADLKGEKSELLGHRSEQHDLLSRDAALHDGLNEGSTMPAETDQDPVTLTTTKAQEVFHYLRPLYKAKFASDALRQRIYPDVNKAELEEGYDFYRPEPVELFRQLPHLRPSVLYCFGNSSPLSTPDLRRKKLEITGTGSGGSGGVGKDQVKEVLFEAGHMLPFEQTRACAETAADWIDAEINRWQATEIEWREMWSNAKHKRAIDDEWLRRISRPERRNKPE